MPTDNPNILFRLSGVTSTYSGLFIFEQNPQSYSLFAPKQKYNIFGLLVGENIYQRALLDNQIRVMKWTECSTNLYSGLKNFAVRNSNGDVYTSYFWDGTVKEFQGATVQVIDVHGTPIAGKIDKWAVDLQFKPTTNFDKEYKVI